MGLTISYTIRLANKAGVSALLAAARAKGKEFGWKLSPSKAGSRAIEMIPHPKCEPVRFDFTDSLSCEEFVKTSFAPLKTHVEITELLRAIQPLAKSLSVDDECEYWKTGDKKVLKKHRDDFDRAFKGTAKAESDSAPKITLGTKVFTSSSSAGVTIKGGQSRKRS